MEDKQVKLLCKHCGNITETSYSYRIFIICRCGAYLNSTNLTAETKNLTTRTKLLEDKKHD